MAAVAKRLQVLEVPRVTASSKVNAMVNITGDPTALAQRIGEQKRATSHFPALSAIQLRARTIDLPFPFASVTLAAAAICRRVRAGRVMAEAGRQVVSKREL